MVQVLQASKVTLSQLRQSLGVVEARKPDFFTEWVNLRETRRSLPYRERFRFMRQGMS